MHEGKKLREYLDGNDIKHVEVASKINLNSMTFSRLLKKEKIEDAVKTALKELKINFNGSKVYGEFKAEKTTNPYDAAWLNKQVTRLKGLGVIKTNAELAEQIGVNKANVTQYLNGTFAPSKQFVKKFLAEYGKYLDVVEIPVALKSGAGKIELPKNYTKEDIDRMIKVLAAYK